jgi:predicted nucleic acid-binding Zn ribbon protein
MLEATLSNVDTEVPDNNTGRCIWCEAKVKDNRRWCSIECRDEHTKYANKL